ncbi:DUF418 domain-containing protein [Yoonia sp. F2084L]|uniref:DUF418 domain-containing protein n=1 Tax=Yoonia sp. F2084L TaxID=2926419 RepID=UPI001FF35F06|nr:DUF418 domain-containing protein [Yoonia sp. F2084L]MCK0095962.1 DUF418 domain-containing protein [Yoonia sp. F2084L]
MTQTMQRQPDRALLPDYLRLIALFGIVVVNVQYIAFSVFESIATPTVQSQTDAVTLFLVHGLALLKTYGLFSFMFGVGLGFLMRASERRGLPFGKVYRNRMIGLLLLGLAHGLLFFPGDILVIYAVTGSILYLFRNWTVQRLVRVGAALLIVQAIIIPVLVFMPDDTPAEFVQFEQIALIDGGFLKAAIFRSIGFAFSLPVFLVFQGISALGWFCLGLAAVKSGMIDNAEHPLWRRARRLCLLPGVVLSLLGAAIWQWGAPLPGAALTTSIAPLATLGYLGLIAAIARPPGPLVARVLRAGGSSLSIYLGQSIILTTIFAGYGFGLWNQVDRMTATLIAIGVTVLLIGALSIWRLWFRQGPFELLLRRITYAGTV